MSLDYIGSGLDYLLKEEGILEEREEAGAKYAFAMALQDEMERQKSQWTNIKEGPASALCHV